MCGTNMAAHLLLVDNYKAHMTDRSHSYSVASLDGSENDKMFSHVPQVALEEISDEEPSNEDVDDVESCDEDNGMVSGDDFEVFNSDYLHYQHVHER